MAVTDRKVHQFAAHARELIGIGISNVPINQAAVLFAALVPWQGMALPPYMKGWLVENVQVFCTALVAAGSIDVQIGGVSILTALTVPVAGAVVQSALVVNPQGRIGKPGDTLQVKATTNGTGIITNLLVTITVRPFPLDNEAA